MKNLRPHTLNGANCRKEWTEFSHLLSTKAELSERNDILPFFKQRHDLSLIISTYIPAIKSPDCVAHEYQIDGDFVADLVIGDTKTHQYLLVEFENGTPESIFKKKGKKATRDWAPRFEGAYSQLVDWLWKLEDKRNTNDFITTFGSSRAKFRGLIVIGKDMALSQKEKDRLTWRMDRTLIDSNAVSAVSFDDLAVDVDHWLKTYYQV